MLIAEMLFPAIVSYADPVGAIAALKVCKVLAANKAKAAIIADALALGAVFTAIFADFCTAFAGTASGAELNAFAAEIAVITEFVCTERTSLCAILADDLIFTAGFAVQAMMPLGDSAFDAKHMG